METTTTTPPRRCDAALFHQFRESTEKSPLVDGKGCAAPAAEGGCPGHPCTRDAGHKGDCDFGDVHEEGGR